MPRINPLNRRPKTQRLVVAVRGAAGSGKSTFAATLADAAVGRLCFFDTERKARLIVGSDGSTFDALEIQHPDELPEFIEWALDGEGRAQGYGCYALDSWTMYFSRKHRETLQAVRQRTGDPLAQPSAEELQADQMIFQEVLRRLCIDSGACVVITDQIGARGKEDREENEIGHVLPMTASGLEYFVDVMLEMSARMRGFELVRVARVVKSNSPAFPLGLELVNPSFADLLARQSSAAGLPSVATVDASFGDGGSAHGVDTSAPLSELPDLPDLLDAPPAPATPTLRDLLATAAGYGLSREQVLLAARHYHHIDDLDLLRPSQVTDLFERLEKRYGGQPSAPQSDAPRQEQTSPSNVRAVNPGTEGNASPRRASRRAS